MNSTWYISPVSAGTRPRGPPSATAVRYDIPRGCAAGYMPELNVLCGIADYSTQNGQRVTLARVRAPPWSGHGSCCSDGLGSGCDHEFA